jgi:ubiquinone/menaquinone biosynthesis C-methylase UbiE
MNRSISAATPEPDPWAAWVLRECRHPDPERERAAQRGRLEKVQQHFTLAEGEVVLDVGTGAGLLGFGALSFVGERGQVIFSDISQELLDYCRSQAQERGVLDRCQFLRAPADDLSALGDATVDVVTLKAVLIYVAAKQQAFREFYRVLKPNGRLYIEEPIDRFREPEPDHLLWGYDVTPIREIARKVRALYERLQPRDSDPMLNFDERDLLRFAEAAGFSRIDLELQAHLDQENLAGISIGWERAWRGADNPRVPTLEAAVQQALTPEEAEAFVAYLRPKHETEPRSIRVARAFLWAVR